MAVIVPYSVSDSTKVVGVEQIVPDIEDADDLVDLLNLMNEWRHAIP